MPPSVFYDLDAIEQIAVNLFYGWGYNFYRLENQLRADDLTVRNQVCSLLGQARASVDTAESAYRRAFLGCGNVRCGCGNHRWNRLPFRDNWKTIHTPQAAVRGHRSAMQTMLAVAYKRRSRPCRTSRPRSVFALKRNENLLVAFACAPRGVPD